MVSRWIQSVVFWWTLGRNDLVGWVLSRVRVDFVRVEDIPGSTGRRLVVRERVLDGLEGGSLGVETVTVHVLWRTGWVWRWLGVCGGSRVSVSVDSRVDSQREQVLVVMGVHVRIHSGTPWAGLLVVAQNVGVQYTSELDVESDGSVLHEHPVQAVLVVGSSEDLGNDQLGGSGDQRGSKVVSEVGVLEQQSVVLLVDTNSVLDGDWVSCSVGKVSVQVVDHTFTVAAKSQWVGHVTGTIFTDIQSVLSLVREVWTSVRNNHLGERHSVENRSHVAMVVVRNVRQDNTFSVVETNVELEVGPFHHVSGHLERNTFWLGHVDRRSLWSHGSNLLFHVLRIEVGVLVLGHLSSSVWNVDVDHLLFLGVNDRTEIQRMRVLRVVLVGSVVNKGLLQSLTNTPSLIVSDGPWVTVNLVHLAGWNTRQNTLLNHSRVVSDNVFGGTQILNGQNRLNLFKSSCLQNR
ncbi:hypothetical protein OGAPHI_000598 [Ogataea philodendri]|uniref:Uncharacterized protein n=1 Tax=Ogataea philodendri TaxID=1378263 RepID=A0A9P8PGL5_9ASCO|nr:uncharacterized protein OGAPHI_000598 [Ogataea philodendri]KAH3670887.1 hypothetical protein OGAPHI_000598 [Ogataea philodendri]